MPILRHLTPKLGALVLAALIGLGAAKAEAAVAQGFAFLSGGQETTPNNSFAMGNASLLVDKAAGSIEFFSLTVAGILPGELVDVAGFGPIHIHQGKPGIDGPVIAHPMNALIQSNSTGSGFMLTATDLMVDASVIQAILSGNAYLNVHTGDFPGGEIRGQIAITPVPAALFLLGPALAGLGYVSHRRRRPTSA